MIEGLKLAPARFDALDKLEQASAEHVRRLSEDSRDHWQARVTELGPHEAGRRQGHRLADARGELKSTLSAIAEGAKPRLALKNKLPTSTPRRERQLSVAVLDATGNQPVRSSQ